MAKFHRFVDPTYFNAPAVPAAPAVVTHNGASYDRLNVVSGGTGTGGSAFADTSKSAGPNTGSYFVAFGEDATSSNANRGIRALAENTDFLDDLMNRDIAMPVRTTTVLAASAVASIVLPTGTFVGNIGAYALSMLFQIVDEDDNEISADPVSGPTIEVASISGAAVGAGFSSGPVTLTLNASIPAGKQYCVYYASRGNLATMPVDALTFIRIRGAEEVDGDVERVLSNIQGGGAAWNGVPITSLTAQAFKGLNELASHTTDYSAFAAAPALHPVAASAINTAGAGAWLARTMSHPGMTTYSSGVYSGAGYLGIGEHMFGAGWAAVMDDDWNLPTADSHRMGGQSGFVFLGQRRATPGESTGTPGLFSFFHGSRHDPPGDVAERRTQLITGATVTLSGNQITLPAGNWFYKNFGGGNVSSYSLDVDIIRVKVGDDIHNLCVDSFTSATGGTLRYIDGAVAAFGATTGTIVDWIQAVSFVADGAMELRNLQRGATSPEVHHNGFFYAAPVRHTNTTPSIGSASTGFASFFARTIDSVEHALSWGGYDSTLFRHERKGFLRGDGSVETTGVTSSGNVVAARAILADGIQTTYGTSAFDSTDPFSVAGPATFANAVTFDVAAQDVNFTGGLTFNVAASVASFADVLHSKTVGVASQTIAGAAASAVSVRDGAVIFWNLGTGGAGNLATMTLEDIKPLSGVGRAPSRITVIVHRTDGTPVNSVNFTCLGWTKLAPAAFGGCTAVPASGWAIDVFAAEVIPGADILIWHKITGFSN